MVPGATAAERVAGDRQTLREFINENQMYEEVVDQINKKIALRNAIDRANDAISSAKRSQFGADLDDGTASAVAKSHVSRRSVFEDDARSRATDHSKLSLITISQRGKYHLISLQSHIHCSLIDSGFLPSCPISCQARCR